MQLLLVHSHGFDWKVTDKAIKKPESSQDVKMSYSTLESTLVVFISVETNDIPDISNVLAKSCTEIISALKDIGESNLILYPWVHLAKTQPAKPDAALSTLKKIETTLRSKSAELNIVRAPFGYYKSFNLNCKGHALAERSKEILGQSGKVSSEKTAEVTKALTAEQTARSTFHILSVDGKLAPFDKFNYKGQKEFELFVKYETAKDRTVSTPPLHVNVMKNLELVDYEDGSDPGNFRILPRGYIVKRLIEDHVNNMAAQYGAMIVETPLMYSYDHESLKKYLERFPARQYVVQSGNKNYFLRFAACFGQFLTMSDAIISYRQLPLKIFEMAKSFRREQRGELAGLRRLRAFTMPDLHTAISDITMAKKEFDEQFRLAYQYMQDIEVNIETAFRMTTEFFDENKEWVISLIKLLKKPILLELFEIRYAYFILKFEFNVVDTQKKAAALSTVQIDVENSERFDIKYTDSSGKEIYPLLTHCSLSGSTERVIYGIIEEQIKRSQKGSKPQFPLWLSPAQVRILPVSEDYLDFTNTIAEELEQNDIRVEIDDRDLSLGKKIRAAEKLWTPIIIVVGEKELKEGKVSVRYRFNNSQEFQALEEVVEFIQSQTQDKPTYFRVFPKLVSHQPIFSRVV
ncbi:threonine--tRNA ligase [Candidatus Heimdallarchaeota archaeon B3_Heim]|nr:MAG: threonine--tRNA ligase [Candidatus Heimdallarchaeota archaeon B3_Heim]